MKKTILALMLALSVTAYSGDKEKGGASAGNGGEDLWICATSAGPMTAQEAILAGYIDAELFRSTPDEDKHLIGCKLAAR